MHIAVLEKEVLEAFKNKNLKIFVDGTVGMGHHANALLEQHKEIEVYIGIDQDEEALKHAKVTLQQYGTKVALLHGNFREISTFVAEKVDGILLDLGVSSMQLDLPDRGFSFQKDGPLDMRMDRNIRLTAKEMINRFSEKKLQEIFFQLEVPAPREAARLLVQQRDKEPILTTKQLKDAMFDWTRRTSRKHNPMTLLFQALRIYVNDELGALEEALQKAFLLLNKDARLVVLSFHSLEDRIVKNFFRDKAKEKKAVVLTKKPVVPTEKEMQINRRSRSAKMRILEKI